MEPKTFAHRCMHEDNPATPDCIGQFTPAGPTLSRRFFRVLRTVLRFTALNNDTACCFSSHNDYASNQNETMKSYRCDF